jgi:arylsulfatase A-like enzyme
MCSSGASAHERFIFNSPSQMNKHSLVLVTVDCLRADHVGFQGYPRPVTPFLDSLANESIVFPEAIAAGVPTYFAFPAIFASRYPLALGRQVLGIAPGEPTIATVLRESGYATAALLAGNPYLSARFGYEQGFNTFRDFLDSAPPMSAISPKPPVKSRLSNLNRILEAASRRTRLTAAMYNELLFRYGMWHSARENVPVHTLRRYPGAHVMVDQACSWLRTVGSEPFFLWIHLMDPHHPHYPPSEALSAVGFSGMTTRRIRFLNSFWNRREIGAGRLQRYKEEIVALYDAGIYWVDRQISRLAECLQHLRRWHDTVLVVTSDHGEEFLEHGVRYHSPLNLPEQLIHVPLLVRVPGASAGSSCSGTFSLLHLAPTVLDAIGGTVPSTFRGQSHWSQILAGTYVGEPAIAESAGTGDSPLRPEDRMQPRVMAVRDRQYKLIVRFADKAESFYDLKNDPDEQSPLPRDVLIRERAQLLHLAQFHLRQTRENRNAELALRARLREIRQTLC